MRDALICRISSSIDLLDACISWKLTVDVNGRQRRHELTSVRLRWLGQLFEKAFNLGKLVADLTLQKVKEILTIIALGIHQTIDRSNLETVCTSCKIRPVHVVADVKNYLHQAPKQGGTS